MTFPSENNKRIAKNTVALYVRMAVTLLVQLYTSRVVLQMLGVEDFGIYNAVGGVVAMLAFINSSMSLAVQRYLSYDLGRGDMVSLNRTFNLSLLIHGLIAVVVALLAETAGYYFLTHYMNFPAARYEAACWVFHFSVLTCCVRFFSGAVYCAGHFVRADGHLRLPEHRRGRTGTGHCLSAANGHA